MWYIRRLLINTFAEYHNFTQHFDLTHVKTILYVTLCPHNGDSWLIIFISIFFLAFKGWLNAKQKLRLNLNSRFFPFCLWLGSGVLPNSALPTSHLLEQNQVVWMSFITVYRNTVKASTKTNWSLFRIRNSTLKIGWDVGVYKPPEVYCSNFSLFTCINIYIIYTWSSLPFKIAFPKVTENKKNHVLN